MTSAWRPAPAHAPIFDPCMPSPRHWGAALAPQPPGATPGSGLVTTTKVNKPPRKLFKTGKASSSHRASPLPGAAPATAAAPATRTLTKAGRPPPPDRPRHPGSTPTAPTIAIERTRPLPGNRASVHRAHSSRPAPPVPLRKAGAIAQAHPRLRRSLAGRGLPAARVSRMRPPGVHALAPRRGAFPQRGR